VGGFSEFERAQQLGHPQQNQADTGSGEMWPPASRGPTPPFVLAFKFCYGEARFFAA